MSISIVQSAKYQPGSTGNSIAFTLGSTPIENNLLIAFTAYSQWAGTRTCSAPDETWTKLEDVTSGSDSLAVWVKTVGASESTNHTFSISGTNEWQSGVIYEVSGVTQGYDSFSGTGNVIGQPTLIGGYTIAAVGYDSGGASVDAAWTIDQSAVPSYHSCIAAHKDDLTTDIEAWIGAVWNPVGVVSVMIFLYPAEATEASYLKTPWLFPQTVANIDRDSSAAWGNLTNVQIEDGNYTSAYLGQNAYTDWLKCTNFGFGNYISDYATILGIELKIKKQATWAMCDINDSAIYLRVTSGQVGDNKATATRWPNDLAFEYYGNGSDLWGSTFSAGDIKSDDFGVDISAFSKASSSWAWYPNIDYVAIRISYLSPPVVNIDDHTITLIEQNQGIFRHTISVIGWDEVIFHRVLPIPGGKKIHFSVENKRTLPIRQ